MKLKIKLFTYVILSGVVLLTGLSCMASPGGSSNSSSSTSSTSNSSSSTNGLTVTYNPNLGGYGIVPSDTNFYLPGQTVNVKYPEDLMTAFSNVNNEAYSGSAPNMSGAFSV